MYNKDKIQQSNVLKMEHAPLTGLMKNFLKSNRLSNKQIVYYPFFIQLYFSAIQLQLLNYSFCRGSCLFLIFKKMLNSGQQISVVYF